LLCDVAIAFLLLFVALILRHADAISPYAAITSRRHFHFAYAILPPFTLFH
jgi:hypothetical protein